MPSSTKSKRRAPSARQSRSGDTAKVELVRLSEIYRSPENDQLYRPIDPDDPEIVALAASIREHGLLEPLIVTLDNFIVSGHRRSMAAFVARVGTVPIRRLAIRRADDLDRFVRLLREHNRQRDKTNAEKLREELVSINPDDAHAELWKYRREIAAMRVAPIEVGQIRLRKKISAAKLPMLRAVQTIIDARRMYWPLSDRIIHYDLSQNYRPLRHASKPDSTYINDHRSYKDLTDLLTRGRLDGSIPFDAIGDETRPVQVWDVHQNVRSFVRRELTSMFKNYWRDLMESQPNHIELVGEKNTIGSILHPVASEYTIPLTTGRGYCSLPPRYAMAQRFKASGKSKLVILIVSDFDPDGEAIAHSFARSMRDDFDIEAIHPIKVALTADQVEEHNLPPNMEAKVGKSKSARTKRAKFVERYGEHVYELEALPPDTLQQAVREAIEGVIDREAFDAEIASERKDAAFLAGVRRTVADALKGIDLEAGDDE